MRNRYSRWDGTQEPFGEPLEVGRLLDEISEDLLSGVGPRQAIRNLMRRGLDSGTRGLDDLRSRLAERRRAWTEKTNLQGPLAEIRDKLNDILSQEREALSKRDDAEARSREDFLDTLPSSPAPAMKELMGYRFIDPGAQQRFDELVEGIQREILGAYFGQMAGAMQSITPDDLVRMREMIAELNRMIAARERGDPYDFGGFMERFGDFFPENPRTLDELLEVLAKRMAAMSRLLASLTPDQRRQLQELADSVMGNLDFAFEMEMLGQELRSLMPNLPWDEGAMGFGDEPMPLRAAVGALEELSDMEQLEESIAGAYPGASIEDIDEGKLQHALGEEAVRDLRRLKQIEKALEEAGVVSRERGKVELTARGIRRIGERALIKVFEVLRQERPGGHENLQAGGAAEPTGATRPWRFGDTGEISVQKSVFNAVMRTAASSSGTKRASTRLMADDFELLEAESRTRTATALLLDLSFSMTLRGHWVPAKRMALALQSLIESKYPEDTLYFIGFSDYARRLDPPELTATGPIERVYGTNMQHAFLLARRLLGQHSRSSKQVIMVTDGEPTAHLEQKRMSPDLGPMLQELAGLGLTVPEGLRAEGLGDAHDDDGPYSVFSWPPTSRTIHKTLAEAARLSSSGVTLNIFMLEEDPGLIHFMGELAKRTSGRVFQTAGHDIGRFVIRDFVKRR